MKNYGLRCLTCPPRRLIWLYLLAITNNISTFFWEKLNPSKTGPTRMLAQPSFSTRLGLTLGSASQMTPGPARTRLRTSPQPGSCRAGARRPSLPSVPSPHGHGSGLKGRAATVADPRSRPARCLLRRPTRPSFSPPPRFGIRIDLPWWVFDLLAPLCPMKSWSIFLVMD